MMTTSSSESWCPVRYKDITPKIDDNHTNSFGPPSMPRSRVLVFFITEVFSEHSLDSVASQGGTSFGDLGLPIVRAG